MFQDVEAAAVSIRPMVSALLDNIHKHLSDHRRGEVIREGVQVTLIVSIRRLTTTVRVRVRVKGLQLGILCATNHFFCNTRTYVRMLPFSNSKNLHESKQPTVAAIFVCYKYTEGVKFGR